MISVCLPLLECKLLVQVEAMDEPWESSIVEYGAVNVMDFHIVNPTQCSGGDFRKKKLAIVDPDSFPGDGRRGTTFCKFSVMDLTTMHPGGAYE